jgi:hypothetical protein
MPSRLPLKKASLEETWEYYESKDSSKYFQELLEKWDPSKGFETKDLIRETDLRNSFLNFLNSREESMQHDKESLIRNDRRADLSLTFRGPDDKTVHLVEFKYGLDSGKVNTLKGQVNNYLKEKVRHVYVVLIEDKERGKYVKSKYTDELKEEYSRARFKLSQKLGIKGIHIYVKQMNRGKSSVDKII